MHGATSLDKKAQEDFAEAVGYLEHFLSKSKYAACDHLTIADIALMSSASTMEVKVKITDRITRRSKNTFDIFTGGR